MNEWRQYSERGFINISNMATIRWEPISHEVIHDEKKGFSTLRKREYIFDKWCLEIRLPSGYTICPMPEYFCNFEDIVGVVPENQNE
jgi:hypothetical protein